MSKSLLIPHGHSIERWEGGEIVEMNLYTCCHCRFTWEAVTGSMGGKLAGGFCGRCKGFICRKKECMECIPFEQRLENTEAGRLFLTPKPTMIVVPDMSTVEKICHE